MHSLPLDVTVLGDTTGGVTYSGPVLGVVVRRGLCMRPVKRGYVNKRRSSGKFRRQAGRTKRANVSGAPMRGGIRL